MTDIKTVDGVLSASDPLTAKQREDVAKMRASLLLCNGSDSSTAQMAMKNITVLRVYHQIARIIKYLDMMDKIEAKLYDAIDYRLDNIDVFDDEALGTLLSIQRRLQESMIESHKLLQPYLNIEEFKIVDTINTENAQPSGASILNRSSRDKLRSSAQQVLHVLSKPEEMSETG